MWWHGHNYFAIDNGRPIARPFDFSEIGSLFLGWARSLSLLPAYDVASRNVRLGEPRLVGTCAMALRPATAAPTAAASHLNPTTLLSDMRVQTCTRRRQRAN